MTIDRFTKQDFETKLTPRLDYPLEHGGMVDGEHIYYVPVSGWSRIQVRSTINEDGIAALIGEDSIRLWLEVKNTMDVLPKAKPEGQWIPAARKADAWTTRVPGWASRLADKIKALSLKAAKVKWSPTLCPECGAPRSARFSNTAKNPDRPFATCSQCKNGFAWLDVVNEVLEDPLPIPEDNPLSMTDKLARNLGLVTKKGTESVSATKAPAFANDIPNGYNVDRLAQSGPSVDHPPSAEQQAVIDAPIDANLRVLASAGSGKTATIAWRYAALVKAGVDPCSIVAVTFNKTMADALLSRITQLVPSIKRIANDQAARQICTIHAFCYRILRAEGDIRSVAKEWQIKKSLESLAEKHWRVKARRPVWAELYAVVNSLKLQSITPKQSLSKLSGMRDVNGNMIGNQLAYVRTSFDEDMSSQGMLTFPDMVYDVDIRLRTDTAFRERWQEKFSNIIVDESQDLSIQTLSILAILSLEPGDNRIYEALYQSEQEGIVEYDEEYDTIRR